MRIEQIGAATLINADCRVAMAAMDESSVDMVLCDLPYGTTQNKWDTILPFALLWEQWHRICKGPVVLTATQPFSSALVMSNPREFRYEWIWRKSRVTGVLNAKRQPLRQHESVLVFSVVPPPYNAQGVVACNKRAGTGRAKGRTASSSNYGAITPTEDGSYQQTQTNWPRSVLDISSEGATVHPTQKPVALMEYLIRTYTDVGMTVLDNCMGSGSTGVACINSGRNFIGVELDEEHGYFDIACARVRSAVE